MDSVRRRRMKPFYQNVFTGSRLEIFQEKIILGVRNWNWENN